MSDIERLELAGLMGVELWRVSRQGFQIPPSDEAYHEYIDRAEGNEILIHDTNEYGD